MMNETLRAWIDLMRLQFFFAWPLLFCSGYLLATVTYGGFSWPGLALVAMIGFSGFEAGFVLNDYIDRNFIVPVVIFNTQHFSLAFISVL